MYYTLTYSQEEVRKGWLWALIGRITDKAGHLVFEDQIAFEHSPEKLTEAVNRYLPSMTGTRLMKSGESWRTFVLP